jgi:hypothetical protein
MHVQFWSDKVPVQYAESLLFEDDSLVTARERERSRALGDFAFVRAGVKQNGGVHFTQNFRLKDRADELEDNVMHGRRACE